MPDITYSSYSVGVATGTAFEDNDSVVSKGQISAIVIRAATGIDSIQVFYGYGASAGDGGAHGGTGGQVSRFEIPQGRRITSIDGHWDNSGIRRLQFVLDDGTRSASFGTATGTAFTATAPRGACLVHINGFANTMLRKIGFRWFPFDIMASSPPVGGSGGAPFEEDMKVVFRGAITAVQVRSGNLVDGVRFFYGSDGIGDWHGGAGGTLNAKWEVPAGHCITRIEGRYGTKIDQIQFFTNKGEASPVYGGGSGTPFTVLSAIEGGELATMRGRSGAVLDQIEFIWMLPSFVEELRITDIPVVTRCTTKPSLVGAMDLINNSSLEQEVNYSLRYEAVRSKTLSFSTTIGFTMGVSVTGGVEGIAEATAEFEFSHETESSTSYTTESHEEKTWTTVVRVPPQRRLTVQSTIRQSTTSVPFSYTLAWYQGDKRNVVARRVGSGVYNDVMTDDLLHELVEHALTG